MPRKNIVLGQLNVYALFAELNSHFVVFTNGKQAENMFADITAEKNGKENTQRENIIYGDNMPNTSKLTTVRSIRASKEFWEKVKQVAKSENTDTNKLVIKAVLEYFDKELVNGRAKH